MTNLFAGGRTNLYGFAEVFLHLGCQDALFLDGDISRIETGPQAGKTHGNHFGAILTVTEPIQ